MVDFLFSCYDIVLQDFFIRCLSFASCSWKFKHAVAYGLLIVILFLMDLEESKNVLLVLLFLSINRCYSMNDYCCHFLGSNYRMNVIMNA